ncbi:MAG: LCP family protein [Lachnospiraceae bacterium]
MGNSSGESSRRISKKARQRQKIQRTVGLALTAVMLIFMAVFIGLLTYLDVLPTIYTVAIVIVLVLILIYVAISQFMKAHMIGKVLAVLLSVILAFGCYYLAVARNVLSDLEPDSVDVVSIIVLNENVATSINETTEYLYGTDLGTDQNLTKTLLDGVKDELGVEVSTQGYESWWEAIEALYAGNVQAIVFNEGYRATADEYYPGFSANTRVLGYKEIENTVVIDTPDKEITNECFSVLLSGMDSSGKLGASGHSDVNIVATVNPDTKEILLVTIPRDSYVTVHYGDGTDSGSKKDKLTHTGNKGIACTMATIEAMLDIDIDYYVRLNFTGLEKLVDALGGIDVVSDYAFTSYAKDFTYVKGVNHMSGYMALIFARERHAFADGDFQRSRNQIKVIQAIADKAMSITMLTNYTGIMESLKDVLGTNIPQEQMTKLVKMQLSDMSPWTIKSYNITGGTGMEYCLSYGANPLSIVYPNTDMIAVAKAKMAALEAGNDPDLVN